MAVIGTLGTDIVFEVSDEKALTFVDKTREVSGRWASHEAVRVKPRSEFLGPGNQTISLTIHLSASLGVRPREVLETIARMTESGEAEYLIIGTRPVNENPFKILSSSEAWDTILSHGELYKAAVTISLEEYL